MHTTSLLIPRVGDERTVAASWERFVQNISPCPGNVRNVILESWWRCRSKAVDPLCPGAPTLASAEQLPALRHQASELYQAAHPVIALLAEVVHESGSLLMLTDPNGTILDLHGASKARHAGEQVNLAPGGCWVESLIGTNAIGTAIATHAPVQIYASEHYCKDVKHWTCAAAPVLDPHSGKLLGVIDISGEKETFHGHSLGLVMTAASQIASLLSRRGHEREARLLAQSADAFARHANACVILLDRDGKVVKTNGKWAIAQEKHGISQQLEVGSRVPAADLTPGKQAGHDPLPAWLNQDWLHVLRLDGEVLGSLLLIPLARPPSQGASGSDPPPAALADSHDAFADIIGSSALLQSVKTRARRLAPLDLPVMLLGETGVGKEVFARAIHQSGNHPHAPFVAVNCGAFTQELLASELFGYAEGAFTGARRGGAAGKFEQAHGGSLFLDEIGEMPLAMQPHLLRVLQDGMIVRLGDSRERRVSVRIIAATNRDLQGEVKAGRFRADLYHRLCVTTLALPALRERREDIGQIIEHLNRCFARKYGVPAKTLDQPTRQALENHDWPGNIRQLKNVYETLFALSEGQQIDPDLLPAELAAAGERRPEPAMPTVLPNEVWRLAEMEKHAIQAAIAHAKGNLSQAARSLGISRSTLYVKLSAMRDKADSQHEPR